MIDMAELNRNVKSVIGVLSDSLNRDGTWEPNFQAYELISITDWVASKPEYGKLIAKRVLETDLLTCEAKGIIRRFYELF